MLEPASILGWVLGGIVVWTIIIAAICVFFWAARQADKRQGRG